MPLPLVEDYEDIAQWVTACTSDPDFKVLPTTGGISMSMVNTELGRPAANGISLQNAGVRNLSNLGLAARAYNTPITMGSLSGATAAQLAATRVLCIGSAVKSGQVQPGNTCMYNYRTGTLWVNGVFNLNGQAAGGDLTSGNYNTEGLIVTGAQILLFWDGFTYSIPVTQYPTFANDWTGIFTIDGGFVPSDKEWTPEAFGGLKIG